MGSRAGSFSIVNVGEKCSANVDHSAVYLGSVSK